MTVAGKRRLVLRLAVPAALSLAGCKEAARVGPSQAVSPPPATTGQAPVNPDAQITRYGCVDGQAITAGYPDSRTAVVTYKDHAYTLKLAPSADGARYTGYGLQWWTKGPHATISALKPGEESATDPGLACNAVEAPGASDSRIRTTFDVR